MGSSVVRSMMQLHFKHATSSIHVCGKENSAVYRTIEDYVDDKVNKPSSAGDSHNIN